ncbi:MAG: hypothetical protein ACRCZJ_01720 [Erysipelotrichaceae bacterium]
MLEAQIQIPQAWVTAFQLPGPREKIILIIKDQPEKIAKFLKEHQFLLDELFLVVNPNDPCFSEPQGVVLCDRTLLVRYASCEIQYERLSSDLQTLVSACGCGLSDAY